MARDESISEEAKTELTLFLEFLLKEGYCDSDAYTESPTVIDQYLKIKRDGKRNYVIRDQGHKRKRG